MRNLISRFGLALVGLAFMGTFAHAQLYNLSSQVTYAGRQAGAVWVVASPSQTPLITNYMTRLSVPVGATFTNVTFTVSNLLPSVNYHLFAWRDTDGNGVQGVTEAQAWHPESPMLMTSNRTAAGFVIADPDNDADLLPDWWEVQFGLANRMGSGSSGSLVIHPGQTNFTDSVWARVLSSNPAGTATLNVSRTNGFASNDLVLIIIMQDTNLNFGVNKAGTYEWGRIASLTQSGGVTNLVLTAPRTNAFTPATSQKIQVLQVPEYTEVTLAGSALSFDGTNDYVRAGAIPLANASFTIEAYARRLSSNTIDFIVGQGGIGDHVGLHFGFHQIVANKFVFGFYNDDLFTTNGYTDNDWHHWAGTYEAATKQRCIYRDGFLVASNVAAAHYQGSGPLLIGTPPWGASGGAFHGSIDDVRIWNRARSQTEIQADMNRDLSGTEADLVAYWRLDEGAGTTTADLTGHGYNGTLYGPTWQTLDGATLTCQPWNGTNGGVLAFVAHQVTLGSNSVISADGKGYRGGALAPASGNYAWGYAGERTTGVSTGREANSLERPQGGGGAGKGADGSGGGGGYASRGLDGGKVLDLSDFGRGAAAFGTNNLARLYLGGGGGGAGSHDSSRLGAGGGAGGGVVYVTAGFMRGGNGMISSCGLDGTNGIFANAGNSGAGGGGGAGGSVYVVGNITNSLRLLALGGEGGAAVPNKAGTNGGAGGVGRIRLDVPPGAVAPILNPAAGYVQHLPTTNTLVWSPYSDTDQDGLSDLREYQLDTNPLSADTDGDGLPDAWEVAHAWPTNALQPGVFNAPALDSDADGVTDFVEFQRGTRPDLADTDGDGLSDSDELFVYHTDPLRSDSDGDGVNDQAELLAGSDPLFAGTQYFYDAIDRLVGVQHENGLVLGYAYDRNNNLVRQFYAGRDANTNALPDLWEFLNGLTNNASGFTDTDGDGWSDFQEWQAGTSPTNAASAPNLTGESSLPLASLQWPFTPSNCVADVGQLNGLGAEEIVIGADGNPGTTTNFLLVLTQTNSSWSTQRVDIGRFGVTSIAVGQPANRPGPAIYVGLRQTGGTGRVVEFAPTGGGWTSNTIATSTTEAAFVLGVRDGKDVLASLHPPAGRVYYLSYASGWTNVIANTNTSQRGLGIVTAPGLAGVKSRGVRLVDSGGLQVVGHDVNAPTDAIWNEDYSRWFFRTATTYAWAAAQAYASNSFGGNLATVTDSTLDAWLWSQFGGSGYSFWIGLFQESASAPWQWVSRAPFTYVNWAPGEPNGNGRGAHKWDAQGGKWDDTSTALRGVIEVNAVEARSVLNNEPFASRRLLWRGRSLNAGDLRLTDDVSILYAFVDDKNLNDTMDAGDEFVLAEYLFSRTNLSINDLQRVPLSGSGLAQSYGLASVEVLYGNQQVFFTAEPDGRVFSWSATNAAAPLQRQLFSAQHTGKAWHALSGVKTLEAGQSLLGLRVDLAAPNRCDVILWPPQRELWSPAEVPQTAPITQILPSPNWGRDIAQVDLRLWDAEGGAAMPELEFQRTNQVAWSNATISISGADYGLVTTSPSGQLHHLLWDAAQDLGPGFTNTVKLRARAQDITLLGEWSPPVFYAVQNSLTNNPRATHDVATTPRNTPVNIDVLANDNSVPKYIASLGAPAHGFVVTNVNQTVRYTPALDFVGTDQFTYTLTDGAGGFDLATVTVTVTPGAPVEIVLESPNLNVANWSFRMLISGPSGAYQVQTSTNLTSWSNVRTVTNVGAAVDFTEQVPTNAPRRFYRTVLLP